MKPSLGGDCRWDTYWFCLLAKDAGVWDLVDKVGSGQVQEEAPRMNSIIGGLDEDPRESEV